MRTQHSNAIDFETESVSQIRDTDGIRFIMTLVPWFVYVVESYYRIITIQLTIYILTLTEEA